ncbi:periplasmic protein [Galbibacter marinus]|uniref:Periplasmic protein n=1 Tax=Galbibacter marinus TaxID=555500 RepID=K2PUW5_9FLAO|nr:DUF748 domain-containing protein [Galbibacter marinus]EKF56470.1 periplasmic protein [Galbibacter marinus]
MRLNKRLIKILLFILGFLVVVGIMAQLFFAHKVEDVLQEEVPKNITLDYKSLSTNVLLGSITLNGVQLNSEGVELESKRIKVSGLHFIPLLKSGDIVISELFFDEPSFSVVVKKDSSSKSANGQKSKSIFFEKFQIQNGQFKVHQKVNDSSGLKIENIDLVLKEVAFNEQTKNRVVPFSLKDYSLSTKKGYYDLSSLEFITWRDLHIDTQSGYINKLLLQSKYNKGELSKMLTVEHDHYDIAFDSIALVQPNFGLDEGSPKLHFAKVHLQRPEIGVYRDKLLPDDTTIKKLYNQSLRDLDFDLKVDSIEVSSGQVSYQERVVADVKPERLLFTEVYADILNIHSRGNGMVVVDINAELMGDGPLTLNWSFDPMKSDNEFLVTGSLAQFDSSKINPFLRTNMKAEVKGSIHQMYFTFSGHEFKSHGDMKMSYDDFEFFVLKKDRLGVNKLLTAVVSIFTNDGKKTDKDGFRYGQYEVERNREKSFFNYLWLNVKEGLMSTMSGNGKKE